MQTAEAFELYVWKLKALRLLAILHALESEILQMPQGG